MNHCCKCRQLISTAVVDHAHEPLLLLPSRFRSSMPRTWSAARRGDFCTNRSCRGFWRSKIRWRAAHSSETRYLAVVVVPGAALGSALVALTDFTGFEGVRGAGGVAGCVGVACGAAVGATAPANGARGAGVCPVTVVSGPGNLSRMTGQ